MKCWQWKNTALFRPQTWCCVLCIHHDLGRYCGQRGLIFHKLKLLILEKKVFYGIHLAYKYRTSVCSDSWFFWPFNIFNMFMELILWREAFAEQGPRFFIQGYVCGCEHKVVQKSCNHSSAHRSCPVHLDKKTKKKKNKQTNIYKKNIFTFHLYK